MGLFFSKEFHSLDELLLEQLQDLYDAELRLTKSLPRMAAAATNPELERAFRMHLGETENHVHRLESVFKNLGHEPERETCDAMVGLLAEGEEMIAAKGDDAVRDAGLIASAQRIEHYEIAGYGITRTFAQQLGRADVAKVLQQTLDEETEADRQLTVIAERAVNPAAVHA